MQRRTWTCSSCGREVSGPILNPERHCSACKNLVTKPSSIRHAKPSSTKSTVRSVRARPRPRAIKETQRGTQPATSKKGVRQKIPIPYGKEALRLPISETEKVVIDQAFLTGHSNFKLRHIDECLIAAGRDPKSEEDRRWFNKEVRDNWNKFLKYHMKLALKSAVFEGLSIRKGKVYLTYKAVLKIQ